MTYQGKSCNAQRQCDVHNVYKFFRAEKLAGKPTLPVTQVLKRTCEALQLSAKTVQKYAAGGERTDRLSTPGKTRQASHPKRNVDQFTKSAIRELLYQRTNEGKHTTLNTLLNEIRVRGIEFNGGRDTLRLVLKDLGFHYERIDGRRVLQEQPEIVAKRALFLREYVRNVNSASPLPVIFQDKTLIHAQGTGGSLLQDADMKNNKKKNTDTGRYIVCHAGSAAGFVPDAGLIFRAGKKDGEYHGEMDTWNFERWLAKDFLPKLQQPSLIVLDSASRLTVRVDPQPGSSWTKEKLQNWLLARDIEYDPCALKVELLELAKLHASKDKPRYRVDDTIARAGHRVLRLPPCHSHYSAMELAWSDAKRYYNKNIGRDGLGEEAVMAMWKEAVKQVTPDKWSFYVHHVNRMIVECWEREVALDNEKGERLVFDVRDSEEEYTTSDDESVDDEIVGLP